MISNPSHVGVFLRDELVELLRARDGVVERVESSNLTLPLDTIVTDAVDRAAVLAALRDELAGGVATGFAPEEDDARLAVTFPLVVVDAVRPEA